MAQFFCICVVFSRNTVSKRETLSDRQWATKSLWRPIDPYHSMSKQKILPVEPLIQCEAGRPKTMQRQSLYSPRSPKWPPSDMGELGEFNLMYTLGSFSGSSSNQVDSPRSFVWQRSLYNFQWCVRNFFFFPKLNEVKSTVTFKLEGRGTGVSRNSL